MAKPRLDIIDYSIAAGKLDIDVPTIRAVTAVESNGSGFDKNDRCIIRFEPHKFSFKTGGIYDKSAPDISYPTWNPNYPHSVDHSWQLFKKAASLNPNAAVYSTSWGLFQILGQNFAACSCDNLSEFVTKMERSEGDQLSLFCNLIEDWGLDDELRRHDWHGFARPYNGKKYLVNQYPQRLDKFFIKFGGKYI